MLLRRAGAWAALRGTGALLTDRAAGRALPPPLLLPCAAQSRAALHVGVRRDAARAQVRPPGSIFEQVEHIMSSGRRALELRSAVAGISNEQVSYSAAPQALLDQLDAALRSTVPDGLRSVGFGEDAGFTRVDAVGIADGIGHWIDPIGYQSALFSRLLMHHVATQLDDDLTDVFAMEDVAPPVYLLQQAFARINGVGGSSTALVAVLRDVRTLRVITKGGKMTGEERFTYDLDALHESMWRARLYGHS